MRRRRTSLIAVGVTAVAMNAAVALAQDGATGVDFTVNAGAEFTTAVATFNDLSDQAADFSATIGWGDGSAASSGQIVQLPAPCPAGPDRFCYEVRGTHTYPAPGSYTVAISILKSGAPPVLVTATATVLSTGPQPSTAITGPQALTIGDLGQFVALDSPRATRHEWDLDGNGSYETDTGADPTAKRSFGDDGQFTIGVRSTFGNGSQDTDALSVVVERPPLLSLETQPADPKPGQKFKLRLGFIHEPNTSFELTSWKIAGVGLKGKHTRLKLPGKKGTSTIIVTPGEQPKLGTTLRAEIGKPGYYPVRVTVHDDSGGVYSLNSGINVAQQLPDKPFKPPTQVLDCDLKPPPGSSPKLLYLYGRCADIAILGEPVEGGVVNIQNASPDLVKCTDTTVPFLSLKEFDATIFEQAFSPAGYIPSGGQAFSRAGREGQAGARAPNACVVLVPSRVIEWDLGDGTSFTYPADPGGPHVIPHTYAKAGSYKVSLLADVPYPPADWDTFQDFDPAKTGFIRARRTVTIDVGQLSCAAASIHGITATPTPLGTFESQGIPACFNKTPGPSGPRFTTLKGYGLDLGGLPVAGKKLDQFQLGQQGDFGSTQLVVDPAAATITPKPPVFTANSPNTSDAPQPSSVLVGFPELAGLSASGNAFRGPKLTVPKPAFDAGFGTKVSRVGNTAGISAALKVGGLSAANVQTFVAPSGGPFVRAWLSLPPPLNGTPSIDLLGGGTPALRAAGDATAGEPTDFSIDIGGLGLGLFELPGSFVLKHKTAGGWIGGGDLSIPLLGSLGSTISAPYKPPPTGSSSDICSQITGPSGIALTSDGGFDFGGATVVFDSQVPVGPIGVGCIAVRGQSVPFVMEGRVSGSLPKDGPLDLNGCFALAVLGAGQQAPGCGTTRKAGGSTLVWMRGTGKIGVFGKFTLGGASLDFTTEGGSATALIAGDAQPSFGPITVGLSANGAVIFPSLAFQLGADGKIWGHFSVPYPCPSLDDPLDVCWKDVDTPHFPLGSAIISSKGFGFCGGPLGVSFKSGGSVDVDLCDLSGLEVVAAAAGRARASRADGALKIKIRHGMDNVAFVLESDERSPIVEVVDPRGEKFADPLTGDWSSTRGSHRLLHLDGQTVVYVEHPRAGTWRFVPDPHSPPVTSLTARDVIPAPAVHGNVTGAGRKRTLAYTAKLAAGDSVRFVEVGRSSSQRIGGTTATVRRSGLGRIRFDTGSGPAGERRIFAEIERHGAPFDLLPVDSYNAPKPPPVPKPRQARAKLSHGRLVVSWRGRESIKAYEVIVKLSDGRVLRSKTTKQHTKFSNVGAQTGVRATVYADGRDGRQSKPAHMRIEARGPAPVTISP